MAAALEMLRKAGYDAYIEHERLYYRTPEGGVVAVASQSEVAYLVSTGSRDEEE